MLQQAAHLRQERLDDGKVRRRRAAAQLRQQPDDTAQRGDVLTVAADALEQRLDDAGADDFVTNRGAVAGHAAEGPRCRFAQRLHRALQQLDELGDRAAAVDGVRVAGRDGADAGETPRGVEQDVDVGRFQQRYEALDAAAACQIGEQEAAQQTESGTTNGGCPVGVGGRRCRGTR